MAEEVAETAAETAHEKVAREGSDRWAIDASIYPSLYLSRFALRPRVLSRLRLTLPLS